MTIYLTGQTGGIGSAIKEALKEHEFVAWGGAPEFDWLIFAHGTMDENDYQQTFQVNTIKCISHTINFLPRLRKGVIFISSTAAMTANSKFPIYSASKAAINVFSQAMAKKHPYLEFYALCPGPTDTKMWRSLKLEGKAQAPEEVAKVVLRIMAGEFKSGDIITVRNGVVTV